MAVREVREKREGKERKGREGEGRKEGGEKILNQVRKWQYKEKWGRNSEIGNGKEKGIISLFYKVSICKRSVLDDQPESTFSKLLSGLSLLDGLLLLVVLLDNGLPAIWGTPQWYTLLIPATHPIKVSKDLKTKGNSVFGCPDLSCVGWLPWSTKLIGYTDPKNCRGPIIPRVSWSLI